MTTSLSAIAWVDVPDSPIVLVPLGSLEQHGPHLPFATDGIIAEAIATAAAEVIRLDKGETLVVLPVVPFGASGEHQSFPGTVSIGHEGLRTMLVELVRSVSTWAGRIVLVNGHGGNALTVKAVVEQMSYEQHRVVAVMCALESPTDSHAGFDETSVMLHLCPNLVHMGKAEVGNTVPLTDLLPELITKGVRPMTANGILGDPTGASALEGARLFGMLVDQVVAVVANG